MLDISPMLIAAILVFVRFTIAFRMIPFMGMVPVPFFVAAGLAFALTIFFVPIYIEPVYNVSSAFSMLLHVGKELLVGLVLGVAVRLCWLIFGLVGGLISLGATNDVCYGEMGPWGEAVVFLGTGIFLLAGGHHAVFVAVGHSLLVLNVGLPLHAGLQVDFIEGVFTFSVAVFQSAFLFGIVLALPMFVAWLTAELLVGLYRRMFGFTPGISFGVVRNVAVQTVAILFLWKTVSLMVEFVGKKVMLFSQLSV